MLTEPALLDCSDVFCRPCIEALVSQSGQPCPLCGVPAWSSSVQKSVALVGGVAMLSSSSSSSPSASARTRFPCPVSLTVIDLFLTQKSALGAVEKVVNITKREVSSCLFPSSFLLNSRHLILSGFGAIPDLESENKMKKKEDDGDEREEEGGDEEEEEKEEKEKRKEMGSPARRSAVEQEGDRRSHTDPHSHPGSLDEKVRLITHLHLCHHLLHFDLFFLCLLPHPMLCSTPSLPSPCHCPSLSLFLSIHPFTSLLALLSPFLSSPPLLISISLLLTGTG